MGQIVKKKKGRPSKADLAARAAAESTNGHHNHRRRDTDEEEEEQRDIRRSLRRRSSVRYNLLDYDEDYLDDDQDFDFDDDQVEDDDEEGGGKREKKLKFVLKLPNSANRGRSIRSNGSGRDSTTYNRRAGYRGSESEGEEEEEEEEEETRFVKKRKICGDGDDEDEVDDDYSDNEDEEEDGGKAESYKFDFVHGTPNVFPSRAPMPEKKQLELILDKLQKKDTYGVYAEPVDPDELPDYHEIIKHPMDFATVRKKLADGLYSTLKQFESDIYLICSNAMQYNAPDTIYHKQAYAIKELAQKKFVRVRRNIEWTRIENERIEKEAKSEQKMKSSPVIKKQMKRPISRTTQDPVSSDFSSGATLATTDAHNTSSGVQTSNHDRPSNDEGPVEGISSLAEDSIDKVEDLQSGKGMVSKLGRKPLVVDENRRGTYEISNHPVDRSESIYSTFEGEDKQLIPVGLYEEHSYAESLARFAATLGPAAWRIASKRIEEALPPGSKFGRGWVVEYEPIPTPVLFVAGQCQKEYSSAKKPQGPAVSVKADKPGENLGSSNEQAGPSRNGKTCFLPCSGGSRPPTPSSATVQQNPFVRKLQNAAIPVKGDIPSDGPSAYAWGEKRSISDAKLPHVPSLGGSRPATPTGLSIQQQHPFVRKLQNAYIPAKTVESPESVVTTSERLDSGSISEGKSSILPNNSRGSRPSTPTGTVIQMHNPFSRNNMRPDNMVATRVEADTPTPTNQKSNLQHMRQFPGSAEMATSLQVDAVARDKNFLHSVSSRPPSPASEGVFMGRFPNWNVNGSVDMNRMACSPSNGASAQVIAKKSAFPPRQEQGLSDPVQAMKLSAENAQKHQNTMTMNNMLGPLPVRPCIQSIPAVGSWMHVSAADMNRHASGNLSAHSNQIPADSLYNRARGEMYPHILQSGEYPVSVTRHFQPERSRSMVFSQVQVTDQSRNPLQSPRQGLCEQKKKRDSLPPDLNVAFQSTVDPQQPDLALQL